MSNSFNSFKSSDLESNSGWLVDTSWANHVYVHYCVYAWAQVVQNNGKKILIHVTSMILFFGYINYGNVQKLYFILLDDGLIFQSKRCSVILASWCGPLTSWFVSLISPVGNLASEITPFLSLRSSSISCPNGGQSHSGVLGGQPWLTLLYLLCWRKPFLSLPLSGITWDILAVQQHGVKTKKWFF